MKRGRGDTLTGGTGDVNPQYLVLPEIPLANVDTFTQAQITLPTSQLPVQRGKAIVMEVLKVYFEVPTYGSSPPQPDTNLTAMAQLSTSPQGSINSSNPSVFAFIKRKSKTQTGTTDSSYFQTWVEPTCIDYSDGAGHGILIATNSIYFGATTSNFTASVTFAGRILYRWKIVALEEYLGMVQSQQVPANAIGA